MNIGIVFFTDNGRVLCEKIEKLLNGKQYREKEIALEIRNKEEKLSHWVEKAFKEKDAIIFISATGIAVRSIAPFIKSKTTDPAVIVIDDMGTFVISLLSGHVGGANRLTTLIADELKGQPVITTATDVSNKLAIDSWAVENGLIIDNIKPAKDIAMDILAGKLIKTRSLVNMNIKDEQIFLVDDTPRDRGINISYKNDKIFDHELKLIPKIITLGIGCRRGKSKEEIEELVNKALKEENIDIRSIKNIASIDLKKDEIGLIEFARSLGVEFITYTSDELKNVKGDFPPSSFVSSVTGVDNVCQRAAVLASDNGNVIREKTSLNGVTLSIAKKEIILEI